MKTLTTLDYIIFPLKKKGLRKNFLNLSREKFYFLPPFLLYSAQISTDFVHI